MLRHQTPATNPTTHILPVVILPKTPGNFSLFDDFTTNDEPDLRPSTTAAMAPKDSKKGT